MTDEYDDIFMIKRMMKFVMYLVAIMFVGLAVITAKAGYRQNLMARKIVELCEKTNTPIKYHTTKILWFEIMKIDSDEGKVK